MNPAAPVTRIKRAAPADGLRPLRCTNRPERAVERIRSPRCVVPRGRLRGLVGGCRAELRYLARQPLDLLGQQVVLVELSAEEGRGDVNLLLQPLGREDVEVACLVLVVAEVARLDPTLGHEGPEAVVDL